MAGHPAPFGPVTELDLKAATLVAGREQAQAPAQDEEAAA